MIVFDSLAWLEYFSGSEKGKIVKEIIESQKEVLTGDYHFKNLDNVKFLGYI